MELLKLFLAGVAAEAALETHTKIAWPILILGFWQGNSHAGEYLQDTQGTLLWFLGTCPGRKLDSSSLSSQERA